jgi:hypothetical protein
MMPADIGRESFELSKKEIDDIFQNHVLPAFVSGSVTPDKPTFASVGGQPGAGKSTLVNNLSRGFGNELTVRIDPDKFCDFIEGYGEARRQDNAKWSDKPQAIHLLYEKIVSYAVENKVNIIYESCHPPRSYIDIFDDMVDYKKDLYIVATNPRVSLGAMYGRAVDGYEKGLMGGCAVVDKDGHDKLYARWPRIAFEAEMTKPRFDSITVVNRNGQTLYKNNVVSREAGGKVKWERDRGAVDALMRETNRPLNQLERNNLRNTWKKVTTSRPFVQGHSEFPRGELKSYEDDALIFLAETGPANERGTIGDPAYDDAKKGKYYKRNARLVTRHAMEKWLYVGGDFEERFGKEFLHPREDFHNSMHGIGPADEAPFKSASIESQVILRRSEGVQRLKAVSPSSSTDSGYGSASTSPGSSVRALQPERVYDHPRDDRSR